MTLSVFTNFQSDTVTGIRDADFAKESLIGGNGRLTGFETDSGFDRISRYVTGDGSDNLKVTPDAGHNGFFEVASHFAKSNADALTHYNPGKGASFGNEQGEGRIIIESMVNHDNMQGLDAGGMNYAEAVGLDSSPVDVVNNINSICGGCGRHGTPWQADV